MIILKHYKVDDVSYVSHKDILRVLQRGLKRAGVDVKYSQGYVPHMLTYTTTPVPLGVQSTAEYFAFELNGEVDKVEMLVRYNQSMPFGMRAVASFYKNKNPNLAGIVTASDYVAKSADVLPKEIERIADCQNYVIPTSKKGEVVEKDIASLIYALRVDGNHLFMRLASGNANLRADSFVNHINEKFGLNIKINDICRVAQLVGVDGKFIDVEELLK
ncbi:MAG: TIGR03936 family radical SAM-associated protein [Clostridia bacterium]|nr:TIGR03936 family radical SAM-associated protein [Clostridia bacterium]MDE6472296.1 TIGR03936 family radical SAM-associated protein [Clostridia bacterium]